jgi:hypothetical protein
MGTMPAIFKNICAVAVLVSALAGGVSHAKVNDAKEAGAAKKAGAKELPEKKKTKAKNDDETIRKGTGGAKQAPPRVKAKDDGGGVKSSATTRGRKDAASSRSSAVANPVQTAEAPVPSAPDDESQTDYAAYFGAQDAGAETGAGMEAGAEAAAYAGYAEETAGAEAAPDAYGASYADEDYSAAYEYTAAEEPAAASVLSIAPAPKIDCENTTVDETSEDWENFKYCMRQYCAGGDDQPPSVQCFRTATYDRAFIECRELFGDDRAMQETMSCHYKNKLIPEEKRDGCVGRGGNWGNDRCTISISFRRGKPCNDAGSVTKTIDDKKTQQFICSYDSFGLGECHEKKYSDEEVKFARIGAGINMAMGAVTGIMGGITAYTSTTTSKDIDTSNCPSCAGLNTAAGALSGAQGIAEGAIGFAQADSMSKMKGDLVRNGVCRIPVGRNEDGSPDYQNVGEGGVINVDW